MVGKFYFSPSHSLLSDLAAWATSRTEDEEFIHKVPQPQPLIRPASEEEFPSLKTNPAPAIKSAWGKGPPKIISSKPSQPSNYQQQQYPPNHQTPTEFLQHRAQTQRHTYGAVPRQPFPPQYGPQGDGTYYGQTRSPTQSPPRGPSQALPSRAAQGGQQSPRYEQSGAEATLNADWANRIQEVAHSIPAIQTAFPGSEDILKNESFAAFLVSQSKSLFNREHNFEIYRTKIFVSIVQRLYTLYE